MNSDARTNNPLDLKDFPFDFYSIENELANKIVYLSKLLMDEYKQNSILKDAIYRTGNVKFQIFYPAKSKSTIDKIDYLLSQYFNLNTEELDFIINYDIKYRMGNDN